MGIAGLVLGILSAIGGWIPFVNYIAWIFGVVGIVLSALAKKKGKAENQPTGIATAGLVLSIIGLALSVIGLICTVACIGALGAAGAGFLD
jgi:energy-converting hydrogenase Eha subunit C